MSVENNLEVGAERAQIDNNGDNIVNDYSQSEVNELLGEMGEIDFDPTDTLANAPEPTKKEKIAETKEAVSPYMQRLVSGLSRRFCHPAVVIGKDDVEPLSEDLAAVLVKHNGELPPWLKPYQEEIALGVSVCTLGFGLWQASKEAYRQEALAKAKAKEQDDAAHQSQ